MLQIYNVFFSYASFITYFLVKKLKLPFFVIGIKRSMIPYLLVFLGGGLGSIARFGIAHALSPWQKHFPYATLAANLLSCLLLGYLVALGLRGSISDQSKWLLMAGFCGGFSTFSTFSNETFSLLQSGQYALALLNVGGSLLLGLICLYLGIRLGL